jgi:hypothetical protein
MRINLPYVMRTSLIAVLCLLTAASCRRTSDATASMPDVAPRLAYVYRIDTTRSAPNDTVGRALYNYDAQGRTSVITSIDINRPGDTASYKVQQIGYAGSDSLASVSTIITKDFSSGSMRFDTIYYRYQGGRRVSDSTRSRYSTGDGEMRVRQRSFSGSMVTESRIVVREIAGNTDTTRETRRVWQHRVGVYFLGQFDSTLRQSPQMATTFSRFAIDISPTVIPHPAYWAQKPVLDEWPDESTFASWVPAYIPDQLTTSYQQWGGGQPATGSSTTIRYQVTVRPDGWPARLREQATSGATTRVNHYLLGYR